MVDRRTVTCPTCATPIEWGPASPFRPFCSERCKTVDMGAWATEKYRVPDPDPLPEDPAAADPDVGT